MPDSPNRPPDLKPIRSLIRRTARVLRSSWVATGVGLAVGLGLGMLALVVLLDLAVPLVPVLRLVGFALVIVPATWAFVSGVIRPLLRRLRPLQVARRIEDHLPGIHNRLVSCIDVEASGNSTLRSPEFYRRLVEEAVERIRGFRPRRVVDRRSLGRALSFAAISVLTFALALGLFSDRIPTALARIFSPLADIPPASGVVYTIEPGDAAVLRGDDINFCARVTRGEPDRLQLEIQPDGNARALRYDMEKVEPSVWRFKLTGFETSFDYRVKGGGTWTKRKRITVVDRPSIERLSTVLHYPEYMGMPEPKAGSPQVADVSGPSGSTVEVNIESRGNVAAGEIALLATRPKRIARADRPERIWFQERLPEGASAEGRWDWDFRLLARPAHTEPGGGVHGHRFHDARQAFEVRSGESLFVMVYIAPKDKPESVLLAWHDGKDWEHRAYWGEDRFTDGKDGSPSRRRIGPLPPAGEWVRLEVPARAVGLEGRAVRGMGFAVCGGQCYWHRAGAIPPSHFEKEELYVVESVPLSPAGPDRWNGRFALERDLLYRVELRNILGYASMPMKEAKATAIPDEPPQVVLERPGTNLVLSKPMKLPLSISAFDDFGLADIVVSIQRGETGGFVGRPVHHFDRPRKSATLTTSLDVPAWNLKPGQYLRYRVEARDRKGQSAQTQDFIVQIADDNNAADKQLENFDRNQDNVAQRLDQLIQQHSEVQATVRKLATDFAPLAEKIEAARGKAVAKAEAKANNPPAGDQPPALDPEAAAQLAALRDLAGQLAPQEEQNAGLAGEVAAGLKQSAEQAADLKLLPAEMLRQLDGLQEVFKAEALEPIRNVAAGLRRGADAKEAPPDLRALKLGADRIQRQLEAIRSQLIAADKARAELARDPDLAIDALRDDVLRASAGLTERELRELQEAIRAREKDLKDVGEKQDELAEATSRAPAVLMPDLERRQGELEPREDQALSEARALLEAARASALHPKETDAAKAPSPEPAEPAAARKDADNGNEENPQDREHAAERAALRSRQVARIGELDRAGKALGREDQSLERVLRELEAALHGDRPKTDRRQLDEIMRGDAVRRALAIAQRNRQLAADRQRGGRGHPGAFTDRPDQYPTTDRMVAPLDAPLPELDPATRRVILKMQPQIREALLQGLREEGPEGYRAFIRNYFKRLTEVK